MEFARIVVGYDGSGGADRAIDAALSVLADGGHVHLVSAADAPSARAISEIYAQVPEEFASQIDVMAGPRSRVENAKDRVAAGGVHATAHLIDDDPADAILQVAEDVGADLIVVGSRGLGRAARLLRGSVSTKIASQSPVDFMVVHHRE